MGFILLLFLFSCSSTQNNYWQLTQASTCSSINSRQLTYKPSKTLGNHLGVRFVNGSYGQRFYTETYTTPFPSLPGNPLKAKVVLSIGENSESVIADRLQGGQRLILPKETEERLIAALIKGEPCKISCGFLNSDIASEGFENAYKQFKPL